MSKGKIRPVLLHTVVGTLSVKMQNLCCQHTKCGARVTFHKYTHITNQFFFVDSSPKYILVGKSHLFDFHYVRSLAVQQLLHGNGTHLLSKQSKISGQHTNTPNLEAYIFGGIKVTPQVTSDTLAEAIKSWILMRYLATHDPKPLNCFDKSFSLKEIIQQLRATLQQFQLRPHVPSSAYCCTSNTFILDGTCKVAFKVCSVQNCMNAPVPSTTVCSDHANYIANEKPMYTGNNTLLVHTFF